MAERDVSIATGMADGGLVVVVNDDPTQLLILSSLLANGGYETAGYTGPEKALLALDPAHPPALIVTDIYMPDIDGWRFCRLLRSPEYVAFNNVPILVVSAIFAGDAPEQISADIGAEAFLPCPVDGAVLLETVQRLVHGERTRLMMRMLVVEDDALFRDLLKVLLPAHGYQVDAVASVAEAESAIAREHYDLAILDYMLGDAFGDTLLSLLRMQQPDCACIMMSGEAEPGRYLQWMKQGAAACLQKPFDNGYLLEVCAKASRERALIRMEDQLVLRTEQLRAREAEYRTLVAGMPDIVMRFDCDLRVLFVSDNVERLTAIHPWDYARKTERELTLPEDYCALRERAIRRVIETGRPFETEFSFVCDTGTRTFGWRLLPEVDHRGGAAGGGADGSGKVRSVLTFASEITARKAVELEREKLRARLQQSEKLETVGRLAGGIAHDFNNMLGAIIGNAELALDLLDADDPAREHLDEVYDAAIRSATITRQLLGFSRQQAAAPSLLDVSCAIGNTMRLLRRLAGEHITVTCSAQDVHGAIFIDPGQFDQLVMNLCVNAGDAIGEAGGTIVINAGNVNLDEGFCANHPDVEPGDYIRLSVRDDGTGMDASVLENIFEPFFTTKSEGRGTGLGLATVYGIVNRNNGVITVSSVPGEGSLFEVYFPVAGESVLPYVGANTTIDGGCGPEMTVLLVEDEVSILRLVKVFLEKEGYHVLAASHPADALREAREYTGQIHLLLTDVVMPEMHGKTLAAELRKLHPRIHVLYISGHTSDIVDVSGPGTENADFLQKPFSGSDLVQSVRVLLARYAEAGAPAGGKPRRSGALPARLPVGRDMAQRHRAAGDPLLFALRQRQRYYMSETGNLVRRVAHACNNLVMPLKWYAENAIELVDQAHPGREWLDRICEATMKSEELNRGLLASQLRAFAGRQRMAPVRLVLDQVIDAAISYLQQLAGSSISLRWDPGAHEQKVFMDPSQVEELLTALCLNAREAIGDASGGRIVVATASVVTDAGFCDRHAGATPGRYVRLSVSDNGPGIAPAIVDSLFEPFVTTKIDNPGAGLGLVRVHGIVQQNKGVVEIPDQSGPGACLHLYLPLCRS